MDFVDNLHFVKNKQIYYARSLKCPEQIFLLGATRGFGGNTCGKAAQNNHDLRSRNYYPQGFLVLFVPEKYKEKELLFITIC
jgi:hypothetical protein